MTLVAQDARRVATKGGTNLTSPTYFGQLSPLGYEDGEFVPVTETPHQYNPQPR